MAQGSLWGKNNTEVLENLYEDLIMINLDITHGNSGGGLFDSEGYLIGLTTLGLTYEETNGAQMNFAVPIYPLTQILDKIILQNEQGEGEILSYKSLGLSVADESMASMAVSIQEQTSVSFYYVDGNLIFQNQADLLNFEGEGVVVLENNASGLLANIIVGSVITGADYGDANQKIEIENRNDLIYFLNDCQKGDIVHIYFKLSGSEKESSIYVEL